MHELAIPLLNRIDLGGPVRHPWDDDDPYAGLAASNPETEHLLGMVSDWARFAYALGCAEWVLVRLAGDLAPWPWQFRDACWAFALDPEYMLPSEIEDHPQEGPVDGPVCLALTTVLNVRYGFDEGSAEIDAAFAERVALHVLPTPEPFMGWREAVLQRLRDMAPANGSPESNCQYLWMVFVDSGWFGVVW